MLAGETGLEVAGLEEAGREEAGLEEAGLEEAGLEEAVTDRLRLSSRPLESHLAVHDGAPLVAEFRTLSNSSILLFCPTPSLSNVAAWLKLGYARKFRDTGFRDTGGVLTQHKLAHSGAFRNR